jgi:hypothetical protein
LKLLDDVVYGDEAVPDNWPILDVQRTGARFSTGTRNPIIDCRLASLAQLAMDAYDTRIESTAVSSCHSEYESGILQHITEKITRDDGTESYVFKKEYRDLRECWDDEMFREIFALLIDIIQTLPHAKTTFNHGNGQTHEDDQKDGIHKLFDDTNFKLKMAQVYCNQYKCQEILKSVRELKKSIQFPAPLAFEPADTYNDKHRATAEYAARMVALARAAVHA